MRVLVLGGTRFFGVHMVWHLLEQGHDVTIATRGIALDFFGDHVKRVKVERTSQNDLFDKFGNEHYDVICDNLAYCSNDVKAVLETIQTDRYIMTSSVSVYQSLYPNVKESAFDPVLHPLVWCARDNYPYPEAKRQAEAALFQKYPEIDSIAVRFPYVIGKDDYTKRLFFYIDHVVNQVPMFIDNLDQGIGFARSDEAGCFLAWLAEKDIRGSINGSNSGNISIQAILDYVYEKTGKKAIIDKLGESAPYNTVTNYTLNVDKATMTGFDFSPLSSWIYLLIDQLIAQASE